MRRQLTFAAILIACIVAALAYFLPRPSGPADSGGFGMDTGANAEQQRQQSESLNSKEAAGQGREAPLK